MSSLLFSCEKIRFFLTIGSECIILKSSVLSRINRRTAKFGKAFFPLVLHVKGFLIVMRSFFSNLSHGTKVALITCGCFVLLTMLILIFLMLCPIQVTNHVSEVTDALIETTTTSITETTATTGTTETTSNTRRTTTTTDENYTTTTTTNDSYSNFYYTTATTVFYTYATTTVTQAVVYNTSTVTIQTTAAPVETTTVAQTTATTAYETVSDPIVTDATDGETDYLIE